MKNKLHLVLILLFSTIVLANERSTNSSLLTSKNIAANSFFTNSHFIENLQPNPFQEAKTTSIPLNSLLITVPNNQSVCNGTLISSLNFTSNQTGTIFNWTNDNPLLAIGTSGVGNINNVVATNNTSSPIVATITVTGSLNGFTDDVKQFTITVNPSLSPTIICGTSTPSSVEFDWSPLAGATSYSISYSVNSGTPFQTLNSLVTHYTVTGLNPNDSVCITITPVGSSGTCFSSTTRCCTASGCQTLPVTVNSSTVCQGYLATLIATPGIAGTYTYAWTVPAVAINPGNVASFSTAVAGTYSVIITNVTTGCMSSSTSGVVTLNQTPVVTINSTTICQGSSATLTATPGSFGYFSYTWTVPSGTPNPGNVASFTTSVAGNYTVTITDLINGCVSASASSNVSNTNITPLFNPEGPYCQNASPSVLSTTSLNGVTGTWTPSTINTTIIGTQTYTFTPNTGQCANSSVMSITVNSCVPNAGFHLNAFIDSNTNGVQDSGEENVTFGQFHYQANNTTHNIFTYSGTYDITEDNPNVPYFFSYTVDASLSSFFTITPVSYSNMYISTSGGITNVNFAISVTNFSDLSINNIPLSQPIPGFDYQNMIVLTNNGSLSSSGSLTFIKDPAVSMVNVNEASAIVNSNGFTYDFTNLAPFQYHTIIATMHVPPVPNVSIGQLLVSSSSIIVNTGNDSIASNNNSNAYQFVIGSYDPNDIVESHGKEIIYSNFTSQDYLFYTIRFENNGNSNAININIDNLLDNKLDETTLEMISSSHNYVMDRVAKTAKWKFKNIQLPPSVSNSSIGKGYITYKIKPKAGYAVGDIIPNDASIFFDTNPAIVTNTFQTKFVAQLATKEFSTNNFTFYPNPAKSDITIKMLDNTFVKQIKLMDMQGRIIKTDVFTSSNSSETIKLNDISNGNYILEITSNTNQKEFKKIILN